MLDRIQNVLHAYCMTIERTSLQYYTIMSQFMLQVDRMQNICDISCTTIEKHRRGPTVIIAIIVIMSSSPSSPASHFTPAPHPSPHPNPHPLPPPKTNFANRSQDPKATS